MSERVHLKVAAWWSGAAICGQAGNPTVTYGGPWSRRVRRVTCKKCQTIIKNGRAV